MTSSQLFFLRDIHKKWEQTNNRFFAIQNHAARKVIHEQSINNILEGIVGFCGLFIHKRTVID